MTAPTVAALYRYPIKGMTPEPLQRVSLVADGTMPFDRAYAIENGPGRFDPDAPRHLPKINFVMLMRNERLASLDAFNLMPYTEHVETVACFERP